MSLKSFINNFYAFYKMQNLHASKIFKTCGIRTMFSSFSLGIDGFHAHNERFQNEMYGSESEFFQRIESLKDNEESKAAVYSDDLKKLIACAVKDPDYIDTVLNLTERYTEHIKTLNLVPFRFGPIIMRLLYHHQYADLALQLLLSSDPRKSGIFTLPSCYTLIMDLLYENNRYNDVKILMNNIIEQKLFEIPTSCVTLVVAANYCIGDANALDDSLKTLQEFDKTNRRLTLKIISFVAGHALKCEKYDVAMEMISYVSDRSGHFVISNIKNLALARTGRFTDVLDNFRIRTLIDAPKTSKHSIVTKYSVVRDVIEEIGSLVRETQNDMLIADFVDSKNLFEVMKLIKDETLHECITAPIRDPLTENQKRLKKKFKLKEYGHRYASREL